ncbi:putative protein TPRXL isoform X26 [Eriocheir sinensis]|uniref:putative protein TPRXL isoform X24 n=1 Tax=Eriocheir sinensis TaxID=95602 RepID=UPI0021CA7D56|nr:putative protein TPRXL isoform X24 [Eriocheir sinensis]XP_050695397.1 putative protein TPRXL isoform X26 [Eriocheir sinensis]
MGHKASCEKANVVVSLREGLCRPDTLRVSYRSGGSLRRQREIASFTFPGTGWWCAEGIAACEAEGGLSMPLATLKQKDGNRTVHLRCDSSRGTLIKGSMTLGRFLDNLNFLHFSLYCDAGDSSAAYTSMRCNGQRCVEAARPPMNHQPNSVKEASDPTKASTTQAGDGSAITKASSTQAGDGSAITKASTAQAGDGSAITKASTTQAGDGSAITKASSTQAGDGSAITKASSTQAGDGSAITKASSTQAGDGSAITKASSTQAGDGSAITKASSTQAGDVTAITKASSTQAGDVTAITKASTTQAGDGSAPTPSSGDKVDDVEEDSVVMTPASKCEVNSVSKPSGTAPDYTNQTRRRRKAKKPKRPAVDRDAVIPKRRSAPQTWADAFVDGTAICAIIVSGVLAYWTYW